MASRAQFGTGFTAPLGRALFAPPKSSVQAFVSRSARLLDAADHLLHRYSMASTKNANYLALELAAPFVCPRIGALAATCKELRAASLSTITWTPFFRRRWPCLAAVEHFAAPADAHALVKALLHSAPPLEDDTACPRDAAGRALPLRRDMILAVQLSIRGTGYAVAHGAARLSEIDLHEGVNGEENELKDWIFYFPIDHLTTDYDVADGRPGLETVAWLPPEIAIMPQHFLVALESHGDADPEEFGDPDDVIGRHLLEIFCREADANLLYEIYVVAGDDIWSFSRKEDDGEHDPFEAHGYYHDHFKQPLQGWHAGHPPTHDDHLPWFPLVREKNFSTGEELQLDAGEVDSRVVYQRGWVGRDDGVYEC